MFSDVLNELRDEELKPLTTDRYGEINLARTVKALKALRDELARADRMSIYDLPQEHIERFIEQTLTPRIKEILAEGRRFAGSSGAPAVDHENLAEKAEALYDAWIINVRPYLVPPQPDESAIEARLATREKQIEGKLVELEDAISAVRQSAGTSATSQLASDYESQRDEHQEAARNFLIAGFVGLLLFTIVAVLAFFVFPVKYDRSLSTEEQAVRTVSGSLARLILLSAAGYVAAFGFRNYRVNKHLETLNARRVLALNTSSLLREAMADAEQRSVIVAELVHAIFASDDTGYLGGGTDKVVVDSPGTAAALSRITPTQGS